MHTARGPKTQRACIKSASVIIQSLSHNQLLGWQGQRCAARLQKADHGQKGVTPRAVWERGMDTSQNSLLKL